MRINAPRVTKVQNYIKTNILSLRQHFVFFFSAPMETRIVTQNTEERREKSRVYTVSSHSVQPFTLHSLAVYFQIKHVLVLL